MFMNFDKKMRQTPTPKFLLKNAEKPVKNN